MSRQATKKSVDSREEYVPLYSSRIPPGTISPIVTWINGSACKVSLFHELTLAGII